MIEIPATPPMPTTYTVAPDDLTAASASANDVELCSSYPSVIRMTALRPSADARICGSFARQSRIAVPPFELDGSNGLEDRRAVGGRSGDGAEVLRKRRDQHPIERRHVTCESACGALNEVHAARHARAAVHQKGECRADGFVGDEVQRLPDVVLEQGECASLDVLDEPALLVLDGGLQQDTRDFGRLGDLEWLEDHRVCRARVAERIDDFDGDLASLEGILVDPLDRIRRLLDSAEQLPIDEEPHLSRSGRWCVLHLRDDPHGRRRAGSAHR